MYRRPPLCAPLVSREESSLSVGQVALFLNLLNELLLRTPSRRSSQNSDKVDFSHSGAKGVGYALVTDLG